MRKIFFYMMIMPGIAFADINQELKNIEKSFDGKIGVYALNTNNNEIISNRGDERFPIQSTMKLIGAAALLKKSESNPKLLKEKIHYSKKDLIFWYPVTKNHLATGMTLQELAEASISYSDTPAINLITKRLGGPKAFIDFSRSIGNNSFNLAEYDGYLNSNPADTHDTATPKDMAISLQKLTLGHELSPKNRSLLTTWLRNNTTGNTRIRAGVPTAWAVADKTGSGDYGVANDIGIAWSPSCKPIVLAIYTVRNKKDAERQDAVVAETTKLVFAEFAKKDVCLRD